MKTKLLMSKFIEKLNTKKPPLLAALSAIAFAVFFSADARTTSRTASCIRAEEDCLKELADIARSPEVERLQQLFIDGYKNAAPIDLDDPPNSKVA